MADVNAIRRKGWSIPIHGPSVTRMFAAFNSNLRSLDDWVTLAIMIGALAYRGAPVARAVFYLWGLPAIARVRAAGGDEPSGPRCPIFEGVNASFMPWFIAFCAWVSWKKPELSDLILGTSKRPAYADPSAPTAIERKRRKQWLTLNTQLYGAVVSHVAPHIQTSLHLSHAGHGIKAITYIKQKYGAHSTGDRAEAIARLQKSVIDPRSKISEEDVTRQYTAMSMAVNDIIATGGTKIDDATLISMMENALPPAYAAIRQMLRYHQHTMFEAYFNDLRAQVKAEERSTQSIVPTAFTVTDERPASIAMTIAPYTQPAYGKGGRYAYQQGVAKGKGKGSYGFPLQGGRGRKNYNYNLNPCFNCGKSDHPRFSCPCPLATCAHCGANHISELCSKGPGGPLRDALSYNAKLALKRNAAKQLSMRSGNQQQVMTTTNSEEACTFHTSPQPSKAYLTGKRPASLAFGNTNSISLFSDFDLGASSSSHSRQPTSAPAHTRHRLMSVSHEDPVVPDIQEVDDYLATLGSKAFMTRARNGTAKENIMDSIHAIAYIDSQATSFVVPDEGYLTKIIEANPRVTVDTANGPTQPDAIGETTISMFDDDGGWHTFNIDNVWVIKSCNRILYSQGVMKELGVTHRLDEGYLEFEDGSKKRVSNRSYSVELTFGHVGNTAFVTSYPTLRMNPDLIRPDQGRHKPTVPQQLVWQRLGCPSLHVWTHVADVLSDHGLPPHVHLKHNFLIPEAVARARARLKPFHDIREPPQLPAPGAVIYMDFAGPMTASFFHKFIYYCGAVDAGSGYSRVVPCHAATGEVAQQCLDRLTADLRAHMGLTQKIQPQVVVTDQGSQFMSKYFTDFLATEQIVHRPAVTYTPQQNALVERMWGTRFAIARTLLKMANLGPALHPFAVQTANWIANRSPQPWKGNLSPVFILSRQPASMSHLKVFGSLTRITIPWARRDGDKHFADRGLLGIYLGPSEQSPGCIIYVPSTRQFYTSRDIICYEDIQPGVRGVESAWRELTDETDHTNTSQLPSPNTLLLPPPTDSIVSTLTSEVQADTRMSTSEISQSVPCEHLPPSAVEDHSPEIALGSTSPTLKRNRRDDMPPHTDEASTEQHPIASESDYTDAIHSRLPATDTADPQDPQSRLFRRHLPPRSTRYTGAYYCDPTTANVQQTIRNAICMAMHTHGLPILGDIQFYESTVSGTHRVLMTTSTADLGDLVIPRSYDQALRSPEAAYWKEAIAKELNGLIEIGTFEFIPVADVPPSANIMRCHMVFTVKRLPDGTVEKFKCRLVADGNTQRWGVDFDKVFSTVAKLSTLRLILCLAAACDYNLSSADIRQAYLQATLTEDLYMMMPPSLPDTDSSGNPLVVRLKRSLYGLKQAGREWYHLFTSTLKKWGFMQSEIDTCLFTYTRGTSVLWLVIWVDDCVIVDNDPDLRNEFMQYLHTVHPTEDKGELNWVLQVKVARNRSERSITLSQELYIKDLVKRFGSHLVGLTRRFDSPFDANLELSVDQCPVVDTPEYVEMCGYKDTYMSLVGAYLWLSNVTRPDLCFISAQLARYVSNPGRAHYRAALRVLVYLDNSSSRGLYLKPNCNLGLRAFVDASWSSKFSVSGGILDFMGTPIHWFSKTQRSVSMSSTEAEFFATSLIIKEVMFFRELLQDLGHMQVGATYVYTDNKGVVDLSDDPVAFKKTKHILRATQFVRDLCVRQVVRVQWISGSQNPADLLTKVFTLPVFRRLCGYLNTLPLLP